jgi:hypothetical protein
MKVPGEEHAMSRFAYFFLGFEAIPRQHKKTCSGIRYFFGLSMFLQIIFVLLESTHFKAPDGSEDRKWIKNGLNTFLP